MDIRLKYKIFKYIIFWIVCIIGVAVCFALYYLIDDVGNGIFVEWFDRNYVEKMYQYVPATGMTYAIRDIAWTKLKMLLLKTLICIMIVVVLLIFFISHLYAKAKIKKTITTASQLIHNYITEEKDIAEMFPKEYAEIFAQIAEIKLIIQHHEQIMKEEADRKSDLIAYLAHDLKTPLTSIIGYLNLLSEAPDMSREQREKYINITLDKSGRLEQLINELFEISRYNLQQINLEKEKIDLSYMLIQLTDEFYPLLKAHGNTIKLHVDENITIYGDAIKLARVFNNILKNAIAYSYPDTEIEIWGETNLDELQIFFQNKGKTIEETKLNLIFEKFFRIDEARSSNKGGAGLGLAIAKEIVTLHGGNITAKSENELTTFKVSLPLRI